MLTLTITNVRDLPDGRPTVHICEGRTVEIGRDSMRDWVLPDVDRTISGRHAIIRHDEGRYILEDVSLNGILLNRSRDRLSTPYEIRDGDLLEIGPYMISASIEAAGGRPDTAAYFEPSTSADDIWQAGSTSAPPISPDKLKRRTKPVFAAPDFAGAFVDMPDYRADTMSAQPVPGPLPNPFEPAGPAAFAAPLRPSSPNQERAPRQRQTNSPDLFAEAFRQAAHLPPGWFDGRDQAGLGRELGEMLMIATELTMVLLKARQSAKSLVRATDKTMIGPVDNNPLKFKATAGEALEQMTATRTSAASAYLDGPASFREAFADLKSHEMATYAAMQKAIFQLLEEHFSPASIEKKAGSAVFATRKAKAWEAFVAAWEASHLAHENGYLDIYLDYFSKAYKAAAKKS